MYLNPYPLLEQALLSDNPDEKGRLTQALFAQLGEAEGLTIEESKPVDCRFAGHPSRPRLVAPSEVTPRKMNTIEGYAAKRQSTGFDSSTVKPSASPNCANKACVNLPFSSGLSDSKACSNKG